VTKPKPAKRAKTASSPSASSPDGLIKNLDVKLSKEAQKKVKGGASDIFAKIGDIKGESLS
jgi:hypothetical protein